MQEKGRYDSRVVRVVLSVRSQGKGRESDLPWTVFHGGVERTDAGREVLGERADAVGAPPLEHLPDIALCVGLGVSNGDQAAEIAAFADGVIVGSAYVRELLEGRGPDGVRALTADLARGVRRTAVTA